MSKRVVKFPAPVSEVKWPHPHVNREALRLTIARQCVVVFDYYHEVEGNDQRGVGRYLLNFVEDFFRNENVLAGRPEDEGLTIHPFLTTVRTVLATEGMFAIPPLPQKIYESLR